VKNKKILIVDDVFQIRHSITQFLIECGYQAFNACNGATAMEACEKSAPDLILLDYNLRDMDCFQFLDKLRKHENNLKDVIQVSNIPVIIFSGYLTEDKVKIVAKKYGIVGYFHKPINLNELLHELEQTLGEKKKMNLVLTKDIIILDSEIRTAKFLAGFLGQFNFNTSVCLGPYDLMEMVPEIKPDLVIYDIHIGLEKIEKFDPYELIKKHNPEAKLFLTTFCADDLSQGSIKLCSYDKIFSKPIDLQKLETEAKNLLVKPNAQPNSNPSSINNLLSSIKKS
jgi:DNA-binding response OmpR family regulator